MIIKTTIITSVFIKQDIREGHVEKGWDPIGEGSKSVSREEQVGKLMRKYAVPCIISLLVGALYNIVDQIFIANASYLGSYGNAANTVVFPLTVIALAIAVMIGDGCCAFVSLSLGKKESARRARRAWAIPSSWR